MSCLFWVHLLLVQMSLDGYAKLIPVANSLAQYFRMCLHLSNIHRMREECKG